MDRLWAGWRSEYIEDVTSNDGPRRSLFKQILESGRPDEETILVWRGPFTSAILTSIPYVSRHLLVMPNREVSELEDLTPEEQAELWSTVTDAVRAIKTAYNPDGHNIGVNLGRAAGAGVPDHLHVHVMP